MNPLMTMFLSEARDLLESISKELLILEDNPQDVSIMNGIFRALHTLKGSSGLFEPDLLPLTQLSHAGEDLLDKVRTGRLAFSSEMADLLLDMLDSISYWLDTVETSETLPEDAGDKSADLVAKLRKVQLEEDSPPQESADEPATDASLPSDPMEEEQAPGHVVSWLAELPEAMRQSVEEKAKTITGSLVAIQYQPDSSCFFMGEDPLHLVKQIPELLALHIDNHEPWADPETLDPFHCILRFRAISAAPPDALESIFRYVEDQAERTTITAGDLSLASLPPAEFPLISLDSEQESLQKESLQKESLQKESLQKESLQKESLQKESLQALFGDDPESQAFLHILQQQWSILSLSCPPQAWQERLDPIVRVLQNCFSRRGAPGLLARLEELQAEMENSRSFEPLRTFLGSLLADEELPVERSIPKKSSIKQVATKQEATKQGNTKQDAKNGQEETGKGGASLELSRDKILKIDQERIDQLVDLVGELVVAKNSMPYLADRAFKHYGVRPLSQEIMEFYGVVNRISDELQASVMKIRMTPVSEVFQRFPRLVRDVARKLGKKIRLITEGGQTEADKNIIEGLADPLIHLVRNSLDHGVETPDQRRATGKDPEGEIRLTAFQEGNRVIIEIQDDGKGIDPEIIKRKAYEKGIIDEARLEEISDQDAIQLIFVAGFSTAAQVSDLSGRGVGMDVVRSAVERVGGSVRLYSLQGKWSRVRLEMPLTMAVTRVMLIEQGGTMYGIPLDLVVETVRLPRTEIHAVKQCEATVIRGRMLPILWLNKLLQLSDDTTKAHSKTEALALLVVRPMNEEIGLVVDQFHKGVDIVIKPLEGILANMPGYSGAALLGDGRVLLVLNLKELL